jgi:folate-dependent tRNA-U54 methylase TrmFO/GidA
LWPILTRGARPGAFPPALPARKTAVGALAEYFGGEVEGDFQPINVNFGIMAGLGMRAAANGRGTRKFPQEP